MKLTKLPNVSAGADRLAIPVVCSLYVLQLLCAYPYLWAGAGIAAIYLALKEQKWLKMRRWAWIPIAIFLIPVLLNIWAEPSHAILLQRLQDFMVDEFGGAGGTEGTDYVEFIDMIISSARMIYIIFLMIAAYQGWQQFQQSEELGSFVRSMVYSLGIIFSVDVISTFILPTPGA